MQTVSAERAVRVALAMSCKRMAELDTSWAETFRQEADLLLAGNAIKDPMLSTKDAMAYVCQALGIFGDDYFDMRLRLFNISPPENDAQI